MTRTEIADRLQCIRDEWVAAEWEDYRLWEALSTLIADLERPPVLPHGWDKVGPSLHGPYDLELRIEVESLKIWDAKCFVNLPAVIPIAVVHVALDLADAKANEVSKGENPHA